MLRFVVLWCVVAVWSPGLALAQETASEPGGDIFSILEEEQSITTGSRVAVKASEAPSSVWVIDRQMIDSTAATNLADLLRRVPGLLPLDQTVGQSEIVVRGFGGEDNNRPLYMIDGRSVILEHYSNNDTFGLPVDIDDIERIEVVLGPASTLYGANAYSGVINIITREPEKVGERLRASVRAGAEWGAHASSGTNTNQLYGPQALGTAHIDYSQALGDFRLRISAGGTYAGENPQVLTNSDDKKEAAIPYENLHALIDTIYDKNGWQLRGQLMGTSYQSLFFATDDSATAQFYVADYSLNLQAKKASLFAAGDELFLDMWGRIDQVDYTAELGNGLPGIPTHDPTQSGEFLGQYATPTFWHNRLLTGVQLRLLHVDDPDVLPTGKTTGIAGIFAQDEFRPIDQLLFTAGVRVETREAAAFKPFSHLAASPRFAIVYLPSPNHSLRAEFSTSYRDPSPLEEFQTLQLHTFNLTLIEPYLGVTPEEQQMGQLSYQGKVSIFKAHAEAFVGQKRGIIQLAQVFPNQTTPLFYANGPYPVLFYGVTAQLIASVSTNLDLWGNFDWYEARETTGPRFVFDEAPKATAGLGANYTIGRFRFSLAVYYQDGTTQPDLALSTLYGGAGTKARILINPMAKMALDNARRFWLTLAGTNVADIRFGAGVNRDFPVPDAQRIGPRVWLGLDMDLGFGKAK